MIRFILSLFREPQPQDFTNLLRKGILEVRTIQDMRNVSLLIETHIPDKKKRDQLHALLIVTSAVKGIKTVKTRFTKAELS